MGSARLTNGLMTAVSDVLETKNYDYQTKNGLRLGAPGDCLTYVYFPRPFPLKATIISARLILYTDPFTQTGTRTITATPLKQSVSFSKVTYVTKPTQFFGGAVSLSKTGPQAGVAEWSIDVTAQMQSVSNGQAWYGWRLTSNFNPLVNLYAPTHPTATRRPRLEITWSDAPQKPTGLAPSGGRAVSLEKPTVKAVYTDVSGSTTLGAVHVQTSATSVFTTPAWDSGTVLADAPELDLSTTSFPGLTDGQTVWWRIRLQDAAGLWSAWSDPATFKRDIKGTLTVENPSISGLTVTDVTPPILWTFTGETQAAWQVFVWERYDPAQPTQARPMKTSGKITGTQTAYTLPEGWLNEAGVEYNLAVRVWDNKQRETIAGDPAYVQVDRVFTFTPSATVAGPDTLTVTPHAYQPLVTLDWSRSVAPDAFNILRNGKVIAAGLLPQDVNVGATTYRYVDKSPSPYRALTYKVQAVQNKVASAAGPTQTLTLKTSGIWLRDPTTGDAIVLAGKEARAFTLSENTAVIEPIADNAPKVLITQAQGLLEGTISGTIVTGLDNRTAEQVRDAYLRMRNNQGRVFYLTTGDFTMKVVARAFTYQQRTTSTEKVFDVSFEFYQQDALSGLSTGL